MTLDEAIKHCEEVADYDCYDENQLECAKDHWQLAEWLRELKAYKESEWIQCSERLPEEHEWLGTRKFGTTISDEVYVTFENPKGERFCRHLSFQNGKLSGHDQLSIDAWYKGSKPIAWRPLPEPWRGEQDD